MARSKTKTAEEAAETDGVETPAATASNNAPDVFDQQIALRQQEGTERSAVQAERDRRAEQITQVGDRSARRHPNLYAIAVDAKAGLRLEREEKRTPGQTGTRLLLVFAEGKLPSKEETTLLHREGLKFDREDKAWTMPDTAQNLLLAKHAFNGVLEMRGVEHKLAVPSR